MTKRIRKIRLSLGSKVSLLILAVVILSVASHSYYIQRKYKSEKVDFLSHSLETLGSAEAEAVSQRLMSMKRDMTSILSLIDENRPTAEREDLKLLIQKNPFLRYFQIAELPLNAKAESPKIHLSLYNNLLAANESASGRDQSEATLQMQALGAYAKYDRSDLSALNYFVEFLPEAPSVFIFEISSRKNLVGLFLIDHEFFKQKQFPSEIFNTTIYNQNGEVIAGRLKSRSDSADNDDLFQAIQSRTSRAGLIDHEHPANDKRQPYIGYFEKMGDNLTLVTEVNIEAAVPGLRHFMFDTLSFLALAAGLMWLAGVFFSNKMVSTPLQKLTTLVENITAGNYSAKDKIKTNDEMGKLSDYFSALGEKLDARENQLQKVTELSNRDGLTGVFNHRYFQTSLDELMTEHTARQSPLSLIIMDIDFYKRFNDEYGHLQGDQVIRELAKILVSATRKTDIVARYGGDEFTIILADTDTDLARQIGERIRETFQSQRLKRIGSENDTVMSGTCSIGIATLKNENFSNKEELIKAADQNLYQAKKMGRNRVVAS
jgi:diguanylate cyclase (GGDEF)-like protein